MNRFVITNEDEKRMLDWQSPPFFMYDDKDKKRIGGPYETWDAAKTECDRLRAEDRKDLMAKIGEEEMRCPCGVHDGHTPDQCTVLEFGRADAHFGSYSMFYGIHIETVNGEEEQSKYARVIIYDGEIGVLEMDAFISPDDLEAIGEFMIRAARRTRSATKRKSLIRPSELKKWSPEKD